MTAYRQEIYANVGDLLDRGEIAPPAPTVGLRNDGAGLFYRGQVNTVFGNPESGKTLIAQCALVDELGRGRSGLIIDLDHNGAGATISRLIAMGADDVILRNPDRFRYAAPDDADQVTAIVADTLEWKPAVVLLDSLGELMPIFAASSNDADDFTRVYGAVLKPLARSDAAVIVVDHLAKNPGSQAFGSTGTAAKKRAIGGTSLRVTVVEAFRPGHGGKAQLTINKDRHGGLRAVSGGDDREPLAATFRLWDENGDIRWNFHPPEQGERPIVQGVSEDDITALSKLDPPPISQRNVKDRLGWGSTRALDTLREWRGRGEPTVVLPCSSLGVSGAEEHSDTLRERSGSIKERYSSSAPRSLHHGVGAEEQSKEAAS